MCTIFFFYGIFFFPMLQMNNLLALKANIRRTEEAEHRRRNDLRRAFNTKVLKRRSKRGRNVFPKPSKTGYTVYGAEWCPWCRKAKDLLTKKGVSFCFHDVETIPFYDREIRKLVKKDATSIPQIFHRGKYLGGFAELAKKFNLRMA